MKVSGGTALRTKYCATGAEAARANTIPGFHNLRLDGSVRTGKMIGARAQITKEKKRSALKPVSLASTR